MTVSFLFILKFTHNTLIQSHHLNQSFFLSFSNYLVISYGFKTCKKKKKHPMAMTSRINYICVIFIFFASLYNARNVHLHSQMTKFVTIKDNLFSINGQAFLFNGFNSYWMMDVGADPSQRYRISAVFGEAAAVGLTVCRTWAFNDGGDHALQISPGVYDEQVFQVRSIMRSRRVKSGSDSQNTE